MTHNLHRQGTREDLQNDWVMMFVPTVGVNMKGCKPLMVRFFQICDENHAVTMGEGHVGNDIMNGGRAKLFENMPSDCICGQATFDNEEDVARTLKILKEEELGISIVISGLIDEVDHMCRSVGTPHHTVSGSLGIWGNVDKLPPKQILAVTTMCGHGLVAASLAEDMVQKIRKGKISAEDAAWEMARDCVCGSFNPHRAARLLQAMADQEETSC